MYDRCFRTVLFRSKRAITQAWNTDREKPGVLLQVCPQAKTKWVSKAKATDPEGLSM